MVHLTLFFVIVNVCSGALAAVFNKRIEQCIPVTVLFVILLQYFLGLLGWLSIGIYAVYALGVIGFAGCLYYAIKDFQGTFRRMFTPGVVIYFLFFVLMWWGQNGRMLSSWDEFTHWGITVKNMYATNALDLAANSTTLFKDYPPGLAVFQYLFERMTGRFDEAEMFRAVNALYFSLIMPMLAGLKWKQFGRAALIIALTILLPLMFWKSFYTALYVDAILGVLFGCTLYNYYIEKVGLFGIIGLSLALAVMVLVKNSGIGLAALCLGTIVITELVHKHRVRAFITSGNRGARIAMFTLPALLPVVMFLTWSAVCMSAGAKGSWHLDGLPMCLKLVARNFLMAFTGTTITESFIKITPAIWLALLAIPAVLLLRMEKDADESRRYKTLICCMFVGAAGYLAFLLITYSLSFSEYEATRLASYPRYVVTCLIGVAMLFIPLLALKMKTVQLAAMVVAVFLISNPEPLYDMALFQKTGIKYSVEYRAKYAEIAKLPQDGVINMLSIGDNGQDFYTARYVATPAALQGAWSIGDGPYYEGDIWTRKVSLEEWRKALNGSYKYVYVYKVNDEFIKQYGAAFSNGVKAHTLYRVEQVNGLVMLTAER